MRTLEKSRLQNKNPEVKVLEEGSDYQILGKGFGHTTLALDVDHQSKILMCKGQDLMVIQISFQKGMLLQKHVSKQPARLVVLSGKVEYSNALGSLVLSQNQEHSIAKDDPHWVEALTDSHIILIKNKKFPLL